MEYIKITGCSKPTYWYKDLIGEVIPLYANTPEATFGYEVKHSSIMTTGGVQNKDAILCDKDGVPLQNAVKQTTKICRH